MLNLFYLILFLLPANLAKHFPLSSSYVSGIIVDYLIPTVYLTDILIISLLAIWLISGYKKPKQLALCYKGPSFVTLFVTFLILLLPAVIFANSFIPAAYKFLKILEFSLFGLWIYQHKSIISKTTVIKVISFSVLFQSLLAIGQWLRQSSLFGYWFFGEQPYNTATPGIDKIIWFDGSLKIPPLATFPHPNILAGFLVIGLTIILHSLIKGPFLRSKAGPYWIIISSALLTLFLTFSLSAWLAFLLITIPFLLLSIYPKIKALMISTGLILIVFSLSLRFSFLAPESSFSRRSQLNKISWQMFLDHPLTGVGLNNFTVSMEKYGYVTATTRFLQPVHNLYLLILSETGLIGVFAFLYLLLKGPFLRSKAGPYWIAFSTLLFLGLFDHYPFTIHQGLLTIFISIILL